MTYQDRLTVCKSCPHKVTKELFKMPLRRGKTITMETCSICGCKLHHSPIQAMAMASKCPAGRFDA